MRAEKELSETLDGSQPDSAQHFQTVEY